MSETLVVDTSIAFKWFEPSEERAVSAARALLERHADGELTVTAPAILPVEFANALLSRGVDGEVVKSAARVLASFDIVLVQPDQDLMERAVDIALADGLAFCDALFVALATELGCPLVTGDRRQADASACEVRLL